MVDRADVELAIRVKDLASAPFGDVAKAVEALTAALDEQVEQARTGKISVGELRESFEKLKQAEQALLAQQGLIDKYNRQNEKLKQATAELKANESAMAAHNAKLKDGETATKNWTREKTKLESQAKRTDRAIEELTGDIATTSTALRAANIETKDLAASQAALLNTSRQVGQAKTVTKAAMDGYARNVRLAREEVRRLAEEERKAAAAAPGPTPGPAAASGATPRRGRGGETGLFGLRGFELQNLGYQVNDVFTQLAGGTGLGQVIGQQGGQILQIFNRNLFDLIALIPRFSGLIAGATVTVLALNRAAADRDSTRTFRADLLATTGAVEGQAEQLTALRRSVQFYGVAWADAGVAMREAMGAGVSQNRLADLLKTSQAIADRTGGKLPEIMRGLTEGLSGGYDALLKLNAQYQFLDANTAARLKAMFDEGEAAKANAQAYEILAQKQQAAADVANGPWTRAMREVLALGRSFSAWLSDTGPIQWYIRYLTALANGVGNLAKALREAGEMTRTVVLENRLKDLDARIANAPRNARLQGTSAADSAAQVAALQAERDRIAAQVAAARATPGGTGAITVQTEKDKIVVQDVLAGLRKQEEAAGGLTEQLELARRQQEAIKDAQDKATLTPADVAAIKEQVAAAYDAELAARRTADNNARNLAYARDRQGREAAIADFLRDQELTSAKMVANDRERVRLAGQKAREDLRGRGGDAVTDAQLDLAQRNAERLAQAEIDKAAAAKAKSGASADLSQFRQASALQTQLASLSRGGGNRAFLDLETRLAAIDDQFATLTRNIEAFQKGGGRSVGGQSIGAFQADAAQAADRAKQFERVKTQEEELNRIIQERAVLVQTYQALQQTGAITQTEALEKVKQAYATSTPEIIAASQALEDLLVKARDAGAVSGSQFDVMTAKLKLFRAEATYVDPLVANLNKNIESAFSGGVQSGIQNVTSALADLASGTATVGDVFRSLGQSVLKILGDIASTIASTIVQFYAMRALSSAAGAGGVGSFLSTLLGVAGSAAGAGFGASALSSAMPGVGFSGTTLAGFNVLHGGGIVGAPGAPSRVLPYSMFANAPRYHSGGLVGIGPDEQAAVLQKGEEVLTRSDPRHAANGGTGGVAIRNVLVMEPGAVAGAMAGAAGERVVMTIVKANAAAIRQMVRA